MSSKLDYLSKYYGGNKGSESSDDEGNRVKKNKKKKKKRAAKVRKRQDAIILNDDDEDHHEFLQQDGGDLPSDDMEEPEEDRPTVVKSEEISAHMSKEVAMSGSRSKVKQRYDSDSDDDKSVNRREASKSVRKSIKRRHDSDSEHEPAEPRARARRRYDSSSDEGSRTKTHGEDDGDDERSKRRRSNPQHDVDNKGRSQRYDSSSEDSKNSSTARMSSGHKAGLQSGRSFAVEEKKIRKERHEQSQSMVDQYGMGDTVQRKSASEGDTKSKRVLSKTEQMKLNLGSVQMKQREDAIKDFAKVQQSTFARSRDDADKESMRRDMVREGDPMAKASRRPAGDPVGKGSSRPIYKGPPHKPNRFGIRPGFRWDGNDRGNGFEDRLLAKKANSLQQKEEAYRMSSAGM